MRVFYSCENAANYYCDTSSQFKPVSESPYEDLNLDMNLRSWERSSKYHIERLSEIDDNMYRKEQVIIQQYI